jgi:competence protein ComEC
VLFINVGKADSILIKCQQGSYLVDTGTKESAPAVYKALEAMGVTELQGIFITHTDKDHIGGLEKIASKYNIGQLYSSNISGEMDKIEELCSELNLTHNELSAGDRVTLMDGVYMDVLGPLESDHENENNNSLVMKLYIGETTFLLTGDMCTDEENTLLKAGVDLNSDVLKVAHHGYADATSLSLVSAVTPKIAVISTSTQEQPSSASPSVKSVLSSAKLYITEDYDCGVLMTVDSNGSIKVSDL